MNSPRPPRAANARACLQCQKRKTKCIQDPRSAACTYCVRARKECVFEEAPSRTPLTRKNLDALERRCSHLENLVRSLGQGIDIEAELEKVGEGREVSRAGNEVGDAASEEYEWHESPASTGAKAPHVADSDGMASMAVETSGYLGSSSASNILQSLSALLPQFEATPTTPGPRPGTSRPQLPPPHNLALNASLAADANTNRLVDAYFSCYNCSYPILHEASFRRQREQRARTDPSSCWTAIHAIVLAIGQWILDEEPAESLYFAVARSWLSARALESGTLGAVQAFLLMGNYVQKRGRPNTAYNMIGVAYRMALALGMHREIAHQRQGTVLAERRRRVFWTLFCFDSGLSITTGRPTTIIDAFMDVRMPRNIDDSFLDLDSPIPDEVDYPTATSAIIAQANLAALANEIHPKFWSLKPPHVETNHDTALTMEVKLFNWRHTLPGYFTSSSVPDWFLGPRAVVSWKEQNLRMLLWRTSQRRHNTPGGKSVADWKCYAAAVETIRDVSVFCKERAGALHAGLSWYATYFLFQAILVLEVSQVEAPNGGEAGPADSLVGDKSWAQAIAQGRSCLQLLKPNTPAGRCLETLDRLHAFLAPGAGPGQATEPVPAEDLQMTAPAPAPARPHQETVPGPPPGPAPAPGVEAGPDMPVAPDFFDVPWNMSADPSLHMLLNDRQMDTIFQGVEGFPGTLDQDLFSYQGGYSFD